MSAVSGADLGQRRVHPPAAVGAGISFVTQACLTFDVLAAVMGKPCCCCPPPPTPPPLPTDGGSRAGRGVIWSEERPCTRVEDTGRHEWRSVTVLGQLQACVG